MAVFDKKSRYVKNAEIYETVDFDGKKIMAVGPARKPDLVERGEHLRKSAQRLDHLANYYLRDPKAYWALCELNDAMVPDVIAESLRVKIPTGT